MYPQVTIHRRFELAPATFSTEQTVAYLGSTAFLPLKGQ